MSIYIEYIIIDNVVMDYIILRLMELTIGIKFKRLSKFFVCLLGCCFALVMPIILDFKLILFLYRILTSIILVLCIKKYKKFKNFIVYYLMFFAYTFFVGGVCLGLIQMLGIDYTMSSVVMYNFDFPFGVFGIILILVLKVMSKIISVIKSKLNSSNYIKRISLIEGGNTICGYGFVDTGNQIKFKGEVVNIISISAFMRLYKGVGVQDILLGNLNNEKLKGIEYIDVAGLGVAKKHISFVLDNIVVEGRKYNSPRFALSWKDLGDYDVILSSEYMGGCYEKINSKN